MPTEETAEVRTDNGGRVNAATGEIIEVAGHPMRAVAPTIHVALIQAMRKVPAVPKDQKNKQQGFPYRGIDQVYNALHGILAEVGIYTLPTVLDTHEQPVESKEGKIGVRVVLKVKYNFFAADGSAVGCVVKGEAVDFGGSATEKALSYAHKKALEQVFLIPTAGPRPVDVHYSEETRMHTAESLKEHKREQDDLNASKTSVLSMVQQFRGDLKEMSNKEWVARVVEQELDGPADTIEKVQQVRVAIVQKKYDPDTGEKIPL